MFHSGLAAVRCAKRANGKWNTHHNFVYLCRFPVDSNLAVRWQMDGCIKINCSLWYREHRSCILLAQKSPEFCWYQYFWLSSFTYTRRTFYLDSYCAILACRCAAGTCDMLCCRATGVCVWWIYLQKCVLMRSFLGRSSLCTLSPAPLCSSTKQSLSHQAEPLRILRIQLTQQH